MSKKVVIIGAGIGSIATASYLAKAGYAVEVYEKLDYLGGRAGVLDEAGFKFDIGPSWYLMPEVFEHYFNLMGTSTKNELDLVKLSPSYKVFFGSGEPILIKPDQEYNYSVFESLEKGAGEKLQAYTSQSSKVYDLAVKHFLYTNFQSFSDFFKWEIIKNTPLLLKLALTSYDREVSRYFRSSKIKRVLEYSTVFLSASPYDTPAIYTLMGALDYRDGVYYPRGGIYKLVESMVNVAKSHGVTFHTNSGVKKIICENKYAKYIELDSGKKVSADIVISNADLNFTETKLLDREYQTYPEKYWQKLNSGPSALMIYLGIKGKLQDFEHHDLIFVDEWQENFDAIFKQKRAPDPASIYMSRATATDPQFAPKDHEALVVLVPFPSGVEISEAEYEDLSVKYIKDIEKMTGISDLSERIVYKKLMTPNNFGSKYNSWQLHSIGPAHTLAQSAILRTKNYSKKVKNLYYVGGATIPGIGMPMVVIGAELIYKRIVGDRKGGQVNKIERLEN